MIKQKIKKLKHSLKIYTRKTLNLSDEKRWSAIDSLSENWDSRTKLLAGFVTPDTRVIEFGAARLMLKNYLPEGVHYTPSDLVDRGEGTIVCDLNKRPLPEFGHYDYCVFSGVLEYVNNLPKLIRELTQYMDTFIFSYAISNHEKFSDRAIHGWVNNYSENEIISIFEKQGYELKHKSKWSKQGIYVLKKKP
ncbi:MAG: class I SAM-dependent methyltransferase [Psychroserpens sp.]|nr:class I SAM-dependent methyltransferase [Psychroserpens sp.]